MKHYRKPTPKKETKIFGFIEEKLFKTLHSKDQNRKLQSFN